MWCTTCRQDVPGIISPLEQRYCCARCGSVMRLPSEVTGSATLQPGEPAAPPHAASASLLPAETPPDDFWETEEQLRHVERLLNSLRRTTQTAADERRPSARRRARTERRLRIDPAEVVSGHADHAAQAHTGRAADRGSSRRYRVDPGEGAAPPPGGTRRRPIIAAMSWLLLAAGLAVSTCGAVLTGWSMIEARPELRSLGLPVLLGGQLALLAGLVLQLDVLNIRHRQAERQLDAVDSEISTLKQRLGRRL